MAVRDIILVVSVFGVMTFGFFIMKRLDKFFDENRKLNEQIENKKEPCCVMLTADMIDKELLECIRIYKKRHRNAYITVFQNEDELYDELLDGKKVDFFINLWYYN